MRKTSELPQPVAVRRTMYAQCPHCREWYEDDLYFDSSPCIPPEGVPVLYCPNENCETADGQRPVLQRGSMEVSEDISMDPERFAEAIDKKMEDPDAALRFQV